VVALVVVLAPRLELVVVLAPGLMIGLAPNLVLGLAFGLFMVATSPWPGISWPACS
jgi:hypothetical protein